MDRVEFGATDNVLALDPLEAGRLTSCRDAVARGDPEPHSSGEPCHRASSSLWAGRW